MAWGRFGPARLYDDAPTDDWIGARDDEVARRRALEEAGYSAWAGSTASGENLQAVRPSDVAALGASVLSADGAGGVRQDNDPEGSGEAADGQSQAAATDAPPTAAPPVRYVKARPGDSISSLLGTSNPGAIGRFATLNGMDGRSSNIYAGRVYALPTEDEGPSSDDATLGRQLLQRDNARFAALRANAANDRFVTKLEPDQIDWTGTSGNKSSTPGGLTVRSPDHGGLLDGLNRSEVAKLLARQAALQVGRYLGMARGAANIARDTVDTVGLGVRLANPLDSVLSPPGQSAQEQVTAQIRSGLRLAEKAKQNPQGALHRAKGFASRAVTSLIPEATPEAPTALEEAARVLPIGANQGKLEANVGALLVGGEAAEAIRGARAAASTIDAGRFAEIYPHATEYWDAPYRGRGSHFFSQNKGKFSYIGGVEVPEWLQKFDVPPSLRDAEIFRLRPKDFTTAQMHTRHAVVDPEFYGGKMPPDGYGRRGWSRRQLGFEDRLPPAGRVWYGASPQLKTAVGTGLLGGSAVDSYLRQWGLP